jgi:uncharacterized protein (TIGR02996 family)
MTAPTSTHDALVRAIIASPDDDTARLAYADWLDEFGTTDQQAARSEWIRLSCRDTGKRSKTPTHKRARVPGEGKWLRANAHRLWPALHTLPRDTTRDRIDLATGTIAFRFVLRVGFTPRPDDPLKTAPVYTSSVVNLVASRGVVPRAYTTFARAAVIAPTIAADEPLAEVRLRNAPHWVYEWSDDDQVLAVKRRPFADYHLEAVWEELGGPVSRIHGHDGRESGLAKIWPVPDECPGRGLFGPVADKRIDTALTRWARNQANPFARWPGGEAA